MWYAVGVWFRNLMFTMGLKKQASVPVTTIGVGNLCAGGAGKTPHVEYLLRMLSDDCRVALLSRGYGRKTHGFVQDDGSHSAARLGDEPAMVARKMPQVKVAVCEKRVTGVQKLLQQEQAPEVVVLDDVFQHRYIKPTVNILLTEYDHPYYEDRILPFGDLRESRSGRFRANIVIVTKSPENLNPIEKHNIVNELGLLAYQKVFFSYLHYEDPVPLMGGNAVRLDTLDSVLVVTGIANPKPMFDYLSKNYRIVGKWISGDHHMFSGEDVMEIARFAAKHPYSIIMTTEKDAQRLLDNKCLTREVKERLYYLPIETEFITAEDKEGFLKYLKS